MNNDLQSQYYIMSVFLYNTIRITNKQFHDLGIAFLPVKEPKKRIRPEFYRVRHPRNARLDAPRKLFKEDMKVEALPHCLSPASDTMRHTATA